MLGGPALLKSQELAKADDYCRVHALKGSTPPPPHSIRCFPEFGDPVSWFKGNPVKAFCEEFFGHSETYPAIQHKNYRLRTAGPMA